MILDLHTIYCGVLAVDRGEAAVEMFGALVPNGLTNLRYYSPSPAWSTTTHTCVQFDIDDLDYAMSDCLRGDFPDCEIIEVEDLKRLIREAPTVKRDIKITLTRRERVKNGL